MFFVSLVPSLLFYLFLRKMSESVEYREMCKKAFIAGCISIGAVIVASATLNLIVALMGLKHSAPVLYLFIYDFIVIAFSEELCKYWMFTRFVKKNDYQYSWITLAAFMCLVGMGFEVIEAIPYAIGANSIVMLVRGCTMMHVGYGFIMGWYYGRYKKTGKKKYFYLGFIIPFVLHGAYDTCLNEKLNELNDNIGIVSVVLAVTAIVIMIFAIRFFIKRKNDEEYTMPVMEAAENE